MTNFFETKVRPVQMWEINIPCSQAGCQGVMRFRYTQKKHLSASSREYIHKCTECDLYMALDIAYPRLEPHGGKNSCTEWNNMRQFGNHPDTALPTGLMMEQDK